MVSRADASKAVMAEEATIMAANRVEAATGEAEAEMIMEGSRVWAVVASREAVTG